MSVWGHRSGHSLFAAAGERLKSALFGANLDSQPLRHIEKPRRQAANGDVT